MVDESTRFIVLPRDAGVRDDDRRVGEKALHESVIFIAGVGHFLYIVKPNEFNAALEMIIKNYKIH